MDIYERLIADHATQRRLAEEILQLAARPAEAFSVLLLLQDEVGAHQAAEEQTLYAEIVALSKDGAGVGKRVKEHDAIAHLIATLTEADPNADGWALGLKVLSERLTLHLNDEEALTFPHARSLVSDERAAALVERFETLRAVEVDLWGKAITTASEAGWAESASAAVQ